MKSEAEKKELETEFDCDHNDAPVCPYCGHEAEDLRESVGDWEDDSQWEATCYNCEANYLCFTSVSYAFASVKLPCGNAEYHKMRYQQKLWENTHIFSCIWCNKEARKELSVIPTNEEKKDFEC